MTQGLSIADVINSQNTNNTNLNSQGMDMSKFKRALYLIQNAGLGAAGTVNFVLQSSPNSNFNVVHTLNGYSAIAINTNNQLVSIEVRADQINSQNAGDRYLRLQLQPGGNALSVGAIGLGGESEQKPASQNNLNASFLGTQYVVNT